MKLNIYLIPAILLLLNGCANFNSVYRNFNVQNGNGAMVDIKQRAIIASKKRTTTYTNKKNKTVVDSIVVCAEPSPDALSAYAAEIAAEANVPEKASAQLAAAFQESSSFTGLRTQSIQLLRDNLYRLCEGYMSGALDKSSYEILSRRYQKYMVALLGIEQLTGAIRAPTVTINTKGSAEAARSISVMKNEISSIENNIKNIESNKKALEDKNIDLEKEKGVKETSEERKKAIDEIVKTNKASIASYTKEIESLNKDKESIVKGIENARGLVATGSATANVSLVSIPSERSDTHLQTIAKSVENIVLKVVNTSDLGQLCFAYLKNTSAENATKLSAQCETYFTQLNRNIKLKLDTEEILLKQLKTNKNPTEKEKEELVKLRKRLDENNISIMKSIRIDN